MSYAVSISILLLVLMIGVAFWRYQLWKKIYSEHARVFISYRRSETTDLANLFRMSLEHSFRFQSVFLDTSSIDGGEDFPDATRESRR
jgi:hypothetical protein